MGMIQGRRKCGTCEQKTLHQRLATPHGVFLLMTGLSLVVFFPLAVVPFGLWLLIGLMRMLGGWRCQMCGAKNH